MGAMPDAPVPLDLEALLRESDWLRRLAGALVHDSQAAEDLVQEAWVAALEHPPRTGGRRSRLRAWLRTIVRHRARDAQRDGSGRTWHERQAARNSPSEDGPTVAERLELQQRVASALLALDEPYRTAVALRYLDALSTREVARRQGVSHDTARQRVSRGLAALRARLDRDVHGGRSAWGAVALALAGRETSTTVASLVGLGGVAVATKIAVSFVVLATGTLLAVWVLSSGTGSEPEQTTSNNPVRPEPGLPGGSPHAAAFDRVLIEPDADQVRSPESGEPPSSLEFASDAASLAAISGRVRVDGAKPSHPVKLRLRADAADGWRVDANSASAPWVETDAEGEFAFEGLPKGWTGRLLVSTRYQLAAAAAHESRSSLRVEAPQSEVILELERQTGITGRLVDARSGSPIEAALIEAALVRPDGSTLLVGGAEMESGGRFFIGWAEKGLASVHIDARAPAGMQGAFDFAAGQIPEDLDLGDLGLTLGRRVRVHVTDLEGLAIGDAQVRLRDSGVELCAQTDSAGSATLDGLPDGVCTIQVLARGFEIASLPAPSTEEPVEVVMQRANLLIVRVQNPAGQLQPGLRVRVSAVGKDIFTHGGWFLDPVLSPQRTRRGAVGGMTPSGVSCLFATDEQGRVEVQSLRPGQVLDLSIEDRLGTIAHRETLPPLTPLEQRELGIRLTAAPRSLEGWVLDRAGSPLADANVFLWNNEVGMGESTGSDGRFSLGCFFEGMANLEVKRRGFVSRGIEVSFSSEAEPLRIILEPGRSVRVGVVDERGQRMELGALCAERPDASHGWTAEPDAAGVRRLTDLPFEELELRLTLAGKEYRRPLGAFQEDAELRVPVHGRLEVARELGSEPAGDGLGVHLVSLDDVTIAQWQWPGSKASNLAVFDAVLPGRYAVCLATYESTEAEAEGSAVDLGTPVTVEVHPGTITRAELHLPRRP